MANPKTLKSKTSKVLAQDYYSFYLFADIADFAE